METIEGNVNSKKENGCGGQLPTHEPARLSVGRFAETEGGTVAQRISIEAL